MRDNSKPIRSLASYSISLNGSLDFCCSGFCVGASEKDGNVNLYKVRKMCGRWECPYCNRKKVKRLFYGMEQELKDSTFRFFTLTVDINRYTSEIAAHQINIAWDILLKRIRRKFKNIKYIKIIEFTKKSYVHIHALINVYIPQSWLSKAWDEIGMGYIVDIKKVRSVGVTSYIAKYLSKFSKLPIEQTYNYYKYSLRRFTTSRNFYKIRKGINIFFENIGSLPEAARARFSFHLYSYLCSHEVVTRGDPEDNSFVVLKPKLEVEIG